MAETLGSLCDKLTIIKLKQFHSIDSVRLDSLNGQETRVKNEIDQLVVNALRGLIPINELSFAANKIFNKTENKIQKVKGDLGELFALLAKINCDLWHTQEKVYDFAKVLAEDKNRVVKKLAILNLERNQCMDNIDKNFIKLVKKNKK